MKALLDLLFDAAQKVKEIGWRHVLFAAGLIALLAIVLSMLGTLNRMESHTPTPEVENTRFVNGIKTDELIRKALEDARVAVGADRVVINSYHNNQTDIGGVPFMRSIVTHKAVAPDVGWDSELSQDIPISTWNSLFTRMYPGYNRTQCTGLHRSEMTDENLRSRFKRAGVDYLVACPILTLKGGTMGMITVGYTEDHDKVLSDEQVFPVISRLADRVSGYLQRDHVALEESHWWEVWK